MKNTGSCPKCANSELYVISPVRQPAVGSHHAVPMAVVASNLNDHEECLRGGTHELWLCSQCGFEEWYAQDVNGMLETLRQIPEAGVRKQGVARQGYR